MSYTHIDFKKWQCHLSLSLMLNLRNDYVTTFLAPCRMSLSPMSHLRNGCVALSILGVKGHRNPLGNLAICQKKN